MFKSGIHALWLAAAVMTGCAVPASDPSPSDEPTTSQADDREAPQADDRAQPDISFCIAVGGVCSQDRTCGGGDNPGVPGGGCPSGWYCCEND
jgi:hypothetical protein